MPKPEYITECKNFLGKMALLQDKTEYEVRALKYLRTLVEDAEKTALNVEEIRQKAYAEGRSDEAMKAFQERKAVIEKAKVKAKAADADEIPLGMEVD